VCASCLAATRKPLVAVALTNVPAVFEQLVDEVNVTAPAQSSFDGGGVGCVTHILKSPLIVGLLPILDTLT
jgi:hypothetical protein